MPIKYKKPIKTNKIALWGVIIPAVAIIVTIILHFIPSCSPSDKTIHGDHILGDKIIGNKINNYYVNGIMFTDTNNKKLDDFNEVKVLEDKIIDAQKGYMKIEISKQYLNSGFDMPVTLSYRSGHYQPVMLTFTNDKQWGAGIIFTSPEYERKTSIYLNQCIRFKGVGKITYITNLIFELYFNDYCLYFVTNSGEFKFEKGLPPMKYGSNLCLGYFDENNYKNKQASKDFPVLEAYFKKYK